MGASQPPGVEITSAHKWTERRIAEEHLIRTINVIRIWMKCGLFSLLCGLSPIAGFQTTKSRPKVAPAPNVPGLYVDVTAKAGVHFQHAAPHTAHKYLLETMGSGVALFD